MTERITGVALLAVCLACGGGPSTQTTTNQVSGTIGGQPLAAKDAISATGSWKGFSFSGTTLAVEISDYATLCAYDTKGQQPPSTQQLVLVLAKTDGSGMSGPPKAGGDFPIISGYLDALTPNALRSDAWYERGGTGAPGSLACFRSVAYSATSGKVSLASGSGGAVNGTFDVVLDSGDRVTGSFNAPACAGADLNSSLFCP